MVHELIRLHGATVEVSSTVGQGTCFTVTIPLGTAHLPSERLRRGKAERIQTSRTLARLQMAQLRLEALHQERTIDRRKDELLLIVSHELNTPLVAILGWMQLLRGSSFNQSMLMKSLETIDRNATLQAKLIQDLLDISRISAGKLHLSQEPVELKSLIKMAIAAVLTAAIAKNIHLYWSVEHRVSEELGSINVELSTIEDRNSSDASYAQIRLADTGSGIPAKFLPHVFDRFCQAESGSSGGLGLGLAIARHLVELHKARFIPTV